MKQRIWLYLSFGLIIFFTLLNIRIPSLTGATIYEETGEKPNAYAINLNHIVTDFFGVINIEFPEGTCGQIVQELYLDLAYTDLDSSEGYGTTNAQRIATLNFITGRTSRYGTLDMAKGHDIIKDGPTDSFISLNTETIVRVPKETRTTYFSMDLYGNSKNNFIITHGSFSTPSVDCKFSIANGETTCDCQAHTITGIRIAGITGIRPV